MKELIRLKIFFKKLFCKVFRIKEKQSPEEVFYKLKQESSQQCYELNLQNKQLKVATFERFTIDGEVKKRLVVNKQCLYCIAINEKNAIRKFRNMVAGMLNSKKQ